MVTSVATFINILLIGMWMSDEELVAATSGSILNLILTLAGSVLATGGSIMFSRYHSRADDEKARTTYTIVLMIALLFGTIFLIICAIISAITGLGVGSSLQDFLSGGYILSIGISAIPLTLLQISIMFLRMDNDQSLALTCFSVFVLTDVVLIYAVSHSGGKLFEVGLCVTIACIISLLLLPIHRRIEDRKMILTRPNDTRTQFKSLMSITARSVVTRFSTVTRYYFLNVFLAYVGLGAMMCLSSQTMVMHFVVALFSGASIMSAVLCGMFYSQGDRSASRESLRESLRIGLIASIIIAVAVIALAVPINILVVGNDSPYFEDTLWCLVWYALSIPTSTVALVLIYFYQSTKRKILSSILTVFRGVVFLAAVVILAYPQIGISSVWISFLLSDIFTLIAIAAIAAYKNHKLPKSLDDLMMLYGARFDNPSVYEGCIVSSREALGSLMEQLPGFFEERGIPAETREASLKDIEGLISAILDSNLGDDKERHIGILIRYEDEIQITIRDDSPSAVETSRYRYWSSLGVNVYYCTV